MKKQKKNRGQKFHTLTARLDKKESDLIERLGKITGQTQATKIIFAVLGNYEQQEKELAKIKMEFNDQAELIMKFTEGVQSLRHAFDIFKLTGKK